MSESFQPYECRVEQVYRRVPGGSKQQVLLTRLFFHVFKGLEQQYNDVLTEHGLNVTTWSALMLLYSESGAEVNPSSISQVMVSSRTNITRVADELESKGWLQRRHCAEDRRKIRLSLTTEGTHFVEKLLPIMREHTRRIWSPLDDHEQKTLDKLFRKLLPDATS